MSMPQYVDVLLESVNWYCYLCAESLISCFEEREQTGRRSSSSLSHFEQIKVKPKLHYGEMGGTKWWRDAVGVERVFGLVGIRQERFGASWTMHWFLDLDKQEAAMLACWLVMKLGFMFSFNTIAVAVYLFFIGANYLNVYIDTLAIIYQRYLAFFYIQISYNRPTYVCTTWSLFSPTPAVTPRLLLPCLNHWPVPYLTLQVKLYKSIISLCFTLSFGPTS